jgi:cytidyltransferase-like protein
MSASARVVVCGAFDDIRSRDLRFLQEASKLGDVTVLLWPDSVVAARDGRLPRFPHAERRYFLEAVRYVSRVVDAPPAAPEALPPGVPADIWAECEPAASAVRGDFCRANGIVYRVFSSDELSGFPEPPPMPSPPGRPKVIATGCYDYFHSGHVRFAEEASTYGDLYICLGSDANVRLLKGPGHPMFGQEERRFVVGSIRHVKQALIATGSGWVDADPEIRRLEPDIYVVNEDGDKGGKREYCREMGLRYLVLSRTPAPGLPARSSTELRAKSTGRA